MATGITYVDQPDQVRLALSPIRRELLALLRTPSSATQLAAALDLPRQRVNYHLRALENAGLVELVEERPRRGCVERIMRTRPGTFVVDPTMMIAGEVEHAQDQYAAEHLVGVAAATVRDVARMQAGAVAKGKRLLTFTVEAEVRFGHPGDVRAFTDELAEALRQVVARFDSPDGRPYRMVVGGHPAPADNQGEAS
ncbi:MAG: helix-turn-helix domain-containing protein [Actinophytocola sp.]|uniref:winged helix-turn-helix domain-containing protein n=1 Tax=Actinophytocola sp. TaxID=1872138 RepID=UPI0013286F73|nr:winged helix-turn-helix domain-containing protein [Actinophytocola sp.]MPZ85092.1 helix-turn-helix domain-containing protein [Actinophytocola sp.]